MVLRVRDLVTSAAAAGLIVAAANGPQASVIAMACVAVVGFVRVFAWATR
ncbi:MAG TPA: hypothetical protein VMU95_41130 [Trebonia sp.]|nr:hypothetical protein [Trebonia sp.]